MKMNLGELAKALDLIGIHARAVSLGGDAENSWCIGQVPDGTWEVFWMERGNKIDSVVLPTESAACFQLLGRLAYTQLAAGAIGRL
ncbi:hypothetical protein TUM20985_27840 [Mycobacterium antarcticum]|uniref:hypothetical protein n=1 Tax=unclassified Mycolicibacterium TaxID=2636767 RepID=UPI00239E78D1|nr:MULTISPECIES: hypothetical protein [unclassified Mycolicibacterium]BDX32237.1 hypothetical protein TUM20985_27840 [Mycolicibacterium sp. TUM20985]GLP84206.1 hypothetical protein TUM20984_56260 [Mycolicibacterium sp. TUM20984]